MKLRTLLQENRNTIKLSDDIYKASLGHDPKKYLGWLKDNGFSIDKKTNMVLRDGRTWKIDNKSKSLKVK